MNEEQALKGSLVNYRKYQPRTLIYNIEYMDAMLVDRYAGTCLEDNWLRIRRTLVKWMKEKKKPLPKPYGKAS